MERIAVLNLKGGIGKTTTAVSLAYILAKDHGENVLLIDCDMQGNASKVLKQYRPDGMGTHTIMLQEAAPEFCIRSTDYPEPQPFSGCLDIIPANMYLMQANAEIMRDTENEQLHRLDSALNRIEGLEKIYSAAIFDCALGLDMTVLNAVIASDMIIAPVPFGGYEIDGLFQLQEQLEDLKAIKPELRLKALFTMKQGNKANREFEEWMRREKPVEMFTTSVRRSITAQKATFEEIPLPCFSKNGTATKDYREVARELRCDLDIIHRDKAERNKRRRA